MSKAPDYLEKTKKANHISTRLRVPEDLAYTEGHFEGDPIVPGVVLIDWALTLAEHTFSDLPELTEFRHVKFKNPLQPGDTCRLEIEWNAEKQSIQFTYENGEEICATGNCRIKNS